MRQPAKYGKAKANIADVCLERYCGNYWLGLGVIPLVCDRRFNPNFGVQMKNAPVFVI